MRLKPGAHAAAAAPGLARKAGGRVGHVYTHAINGFQMKGSAAAAAALRRSARVLSVTRDHAVQLTETDPFGIARIGAFVVGGGDAYSAGFRGAGTRIAVIDTGIDLDHPDLAAQHRYLDRPELRQPGAATQRRPRARDARRGDRGGAAEQRRRGRRGARGAARPDQDVR